MNKKNFFRKHVKKQIFSVETENYQSRKQNYISKNEGKYFLKQKQ